MAIERPSGQSGRTGGPGPKRDSKDFYGGAVFGRISAKIGTFLFLFFVIRGDCASLSPSVVTDLKLFGWVSCVFPGKDKKTKKVKIF